MYSKITHPVTGREVSIKSRLGKRILHKYLNFMKGGSSSDSEESEYTVEEAWESLRNWRRNEENTWALDALQDDDSSFNKEYLYDNLEEQVLYHDHGHELYTDDIIIRYLNMFLDSEYARGLDLETLRTRYDAQRPASIGGPLLSGSGGGGGGSDADAAAAAAEGGGGGSDADAAAAATKAVDETPAWAERLKQQGVSVKVIQDALAQLEDEGIEGSTTLPECSICLDGISREEEFLNQCGHTFHVRCIEQWRESQRTREGSTCPLCRQGIKRLTLHDAVGKGDLKKIQMFLDQGADIDRAMTDGATPLLIAAENGHAGADKGQLYTAAMGRVTPVMVAAKRKHHEVVALFLATETDPSKITEILEIMIRNI